MRVAGVIAPQDKLAGIVSASETVPVNPLSGETMIVEGAEDPTNTAAEDVADIEKSVTVKVTVAE